MDINEIIIKGIKAYCDKLNEMYVECNDNCALCDEDGECKYYEAIDYIKRVKE